MARSAPECLPHDEVHVWLADPGALAPQLSPRRLATLLPPDELARGRGMRSLRARRAHLGGRVLLRLTLSRYRRVEPSAWELVLGPAGRPEIAGPAEGAGLRFNLSHAEGLMALALVRDLDVGVDVECSTRPAPSLRLAERYFAASEARALGELPEDERRAGFFRLWTLKESYLKARGSGIGRGLRHVRFDAAGGERPRARFDPELGERASDWQFLVRTPTPRHTLAVALRRGQRPDCVVRIREFTPASGP